MSPIVCHCTECQKQSASAFGMSLPVLRLEPVAQAWTKSAQPWLKLANDLTSFPGQPKNLPTLLKR